MAQTNTAQDPVSPEAPLVIGGAATEQPAPVEVAVSEQAPVQPEQAVEQPVPAQPASVEVAPVAPAPEVAPVVEASPVPPVPEKTVEEKTIDDILSAELEDAVAVLPGDAKTKFIQKGNETVGAVAQILFADKTSEKDLLKLVGTWFAEAKGLDEHYVKQEVARKVGKLWEYRKEHRSEE